MTPQRSEPPAKAAAPKTAPAPQQQTVAPSPSQAPKAAISRSEARQQIRELQVKQREELRAKDLKPAERQQLRAQQREQLRDLQVKQREQRSVTPDAQQAGQPKTDAQTRLQDRQQLRDLRAKQQQDLRNPNLKPAERRDLIAKQRNEVRDLVAKQREQRSAPDTQQAAQQLKGDAQSRLQDRQQLRDLRAKQQQDLRNPNLTPAQRRDLIAKQREEFRNLRAEQTNRRLGIAQQPSQQQQQAQQLRRDGKPRVTEDVARRGRFAAALPELEERSELAGQARRPGSRRASPRVHAWRQGHVAVFVAWAGPVFYPYAYSDIFEYTFWPYAYDEGYWAYAYDDFIDSMFWVEASPYSDYAYGGPSPRGYASYTTGSRTIDGFSAARIGRAAQRRRRKSAAIRAKAITAWPFAADRTGGASECRAAPACWTT